LWFLEKRRRIWKKEVGWSDPLMEEEKKKRKKKKRQTCSIGGITGVEPKKGLTKSHSSSSSGHKRESLEFED